MRNHVLTPPKVISSRLPHAQRTLHHPKMPASPRLPRETTVPRVMKANRASAVPEWPRSKRTSTLPWNPYAPLPPHLPCETHVNRARCSNGTSECIQSRSACTHFPFPYRCSSVTNEGRPLLFQALRHDLLAMRERSGSAAFRTILGAPRVGGTSISGRSPLSLATDVQRNIGIISPGHRDTVLHFRRSQTLCFIDQRRPPFTTHEEVVVRQGVPNK